MTTKYIYLTGIIEWAKVREPDEKYNNYTIDLYLDDPSWAVFKASEIQVTPKEKDGKKFVTFRRPHVKLIKNDMVTFGPPEVLINTGKKDDSGTSIYEKYDGIIGNGSFVSIKVAVYDTQRGKGHRLETVAVETLVEYNPEPKDSGPKMPF